MSAFASGCSNSATYQQIPAPNNSADLQPDTRPSVFSEHMLSSEFSNLPGSTAPSGNVVSLLLKNITELIMLLFTNQNSLNWNSLFKDLISVVEKNISQNG